MLNWKDPFNKKKVIELEKQLSLLATSVFKEDTVDMQTVSTRGSYATDAFNNPVMREAFKHVDTELWDSWKKTMDDDKERREIIYGYLKMLEAIKLQLVMFIKNAQLDAEIRKEKV